MTDETNQQDSVPSSGEPVVEPHSQEAGGAVTGEGVAPAADASSTADSASATPVSIAATSSPSDASSRVDGTHSFEQRVEDRFLQLEGFLMKLPHSIHHAMSQGSADAEEFVGRVVKHLFSKE